MLQKKSGVVTITATSSNGKTSEKKLNVKDVSNYIERVDEMIERKRSFFNEN